MGQVLRTTMLNKATPQEHVSLKAQAWRVDFQERPSMADLRSVVIKEPRNVNAVLTPVDVEEALASGRTESGGSLIIVWMPPGVNTPPSIEHDVDAWMRDSASSVRQTPVRATIRTVRVIWHDTRALVYTNAEQLDDAIDAVVRFTVAERETTALELAMDSTWASIDADAPLTHAAASRQQKQQQHVNELTELATRMKAMYLRVSKALEQLDPALGESSKRLYSELANAALLWDRVEPLGEPIQFALDQYELANTRLIEAKTAAMEHLHAMIGHVLEVGIIVLLLCQLRILW
jgi:hypothetical protein